MKVWTEIAAERLAGNFRALSSLIGEGGASALLAVVKANAYGHGIDPCAAILARAGAEWLGVTDAQEGARVREVLRAAGFAGDQELTSQNRDVGHPALSSSHVSESRHGAPSHYKPEILVMSGTCELEGESECIVRNRLTAVVWEASHVERLADAARAAGVAEPLRVHVEVDSGMSRQGVAPGVGLDVVLRSIAAEPRVALGGVFTHFASTEVAGSQQTAAQQKVFEAALGQVAASGLRPQWVHVGNSSYIDNPVIEKRGDGAGALKWLAKLAATLGARAMVRSGLALYGYLLPIEGAGQSLASSRVLPVMTWKTRVIGVREVAAGALVGYHGAFVAERPMRLALLPLGYADGLRRELSSTNTRPGGWVMIRGERAAIVGRVSMNLTTVDVSGIAGVAAGDEVVVLGEGATANDHARLAGTIAYEIVCGVKTSE